MPLIERALAGEIVNAEGWMPHLQGARYVRRFYLPYLSDTGSVHRLFPLPRGPDRCEGRRSGSSPSKCGAALERGVQRGDPASSLDCIIAIDEVGLVLEFNPAAERTFGYARADTIGRPISELIIPRRLRQRHGDGLARYLRGGATTVLAGASRSRACAPTASVFPVELAITEVRLPQQRLFTAYLRDLTAVRQLQPRSSASARRCIRARSWRRSVRCSAASRTSSTTRSPRHRQCAHAGRGDSGRGAAFAERAGASRRRPSAAAASRRSFLAMARQRETQKRPVGRRCPGRQRAGAARLRDQGQRHAIERRSRRGCGDAVRSDQINQVVTNLLRERPAGIGGAGARTPHPHRRGDARRRRRDRDRR